MQHKIFLFQVKVPEKLLLDECSYGTYAGTVESVELEPKFPLIPGDIRLDGEEDPKLTTLSLLLNVVGSSVFVFEFEFVLVFKFLVCE